MPTTSEEIADLISAYTDLKQYFENYRTDMESRLAAKEAEIDQAISDLALQEDGIDLKQYLDNMRINIEAELTQNITKSDVGLSNVPNYAATSSVSDDSDDKLATAAAVKKAYDKANATSSRRLVWGTVQMTDYVEERHNRVLNIDVPEGSVMVGLERRYDSDRGSDAGGIYVWRAKYRTISSS